MVWKNFLGVFVLGGAALIAAPASAQTVNATLGATYYRVAINTDPDFPGNNPIVAAGSSLGANGLPVGTGVADINSPTGEITWWSPALNPNIQQTGTGTISLPFASNMYAPNSTGVNDNLYFMTARFTGVFTLSSLSTIQFTLGSDDDSFIYVDGLLFGQNPGIHATSVVTFTTPALDVGQHTLDVFYADREHTGAYLSLNLVSAGVIITPPASGVPEPASWMMMIAGFGLIGAALRRRQDQLATA